MPRLKKKSVGEKLKYKAEQARAARANETGEQANARRCLDREFKAVTRENETVERTNARRCLDREFKAVTRENETVEQTNARRCRDREFKAVRRERTAVESLEVERSKLKFWKKIETGPIFDCCSCSRLHYRVSVVEYIHTKYQCNVITDEICSRSKNSNASEKLWICKTCQNALKKEKYLLRV